MKTDVGVHPNMCDRFYTKDIKLDKIENTL
jgi:hypothetical protein